MTEGRRDFFKGEEIEEILKDKVEFLQIFNIQAFSYAIRSDAIKYLCI